jgi:hypothetical protein
MADLNELGEIEKQLKKLVEERQSHDKIWREGGIVMEDDTEYNQNKSKRQIKDAADKLFQSSETFMVVVEHGKPFERDYMKDYMPGMFMGVPEHGRPFDSSYSRMAVQEHGRPFARRTDMKIEEHGQPFDQTPRRIVTKMRSREHGQPYDKPRTLMVAEEHGRPFFSSITSWLSSSSSSASAEEATSRKPVISTNMVIREHGQPYERTQFPRGEVHQISKDEVAKRFKL